MTSNIDSDDNSNYPDDMDAAFEESQSRQNQAYKEYSMKMEREKKRQAFLNNETLNEDLDDESKLDKMELFEESQKRKDEAFDEYTKKLQREIQRQELLKMRN